jgi:hypothetical protein
VIEANDRNGATALVPLLSVSCGCALVQEESGRVTFDALSTLLADLKKRAKRSPQKIAVETVSGS